MRLSILLISFLSIACFSFAQERCGTVAHEKMRNAGTLEKKEEHFEKWMKGEIAHRSSKTLQRTQASPYIVPVVVHVIHNGESIGTGTNISEAQIQSQIDVLNADFRRLNTDAANTPSEFQSVAGSMNIQFVLAKQDPFGVTTNGIVRVKGTKSSWTMNNESTFKSLSFWRSDRYLNIWVLNMTDYLGYGQFPNPAGTSLAGLDEADMSYDSITDGVSIYYKAFGAGNFDLEEQYNRGRTVTHEVGHFFGLRHIWGDNSNCTTTTDYVTDTPKQNTSTSGCPSSQQTSCGGSKMFQNYLDYTDDACMNLFTQGQIDRMDIVINNALRRKSLLTSPGATPTTSQPLLDIALNGLKSPGPVLCTANPIPRLSIINSGNTLINTFNVETSVNGSTAITEVFSNVELVPGEEIEINLNAIALKAGSNTIQFTLKNPNGIADNTNNNSLKRNVAFNQSADIVPLRQNFNSDFSNWSIVSPGDGTVWTAANTNYTKSLMYKSFGNTSTGLQSWLVSPTLDLSHLTEASLHFDVSYAMRSSLAPERLQVFASEDCGVTYPTLLYDKQGDEIKYIHNSYIMAAINNRLEK